MTPFLELIFNADLITDDGVNSERLKRLKPSRLADIALASVDLCATSNVEPQENAFTHTASLALSGGSLPCGSLDCRLARAQELARFGALFSDKVYVHNILADRRNGVGEASYKERFSADLEVIHTLMPLIKTGRVAPLSTQTNKQCLHCAAHRAMDAGESQRFASALRKLSKRLSNETEVVLEQRHGIFSICIKGSEELVDHGSSAVCFDQIPEFIKAMPRIANALQRGETVKASMSLRRKIGMEAKFAHETFDTVAFELVASQFLKTSLLTERSLEVELLRNIAPKKLRMEESDKLLSDHLTCVIPFLNELTIEQILALRDSEGDALSTFRVALLKSIDEQKNRKGKFTEPEAKALYRDVLEPELARLNTKVKTARRAVASAALRSGLGWGAAITVGVWYGFLQSSIVEAAKALGMVKVLADGATSMLALREQSEAIRNEPMYFLWKARKLARA